MKNIPAEIDALMWRLAEEGGPVAQAEFEARHARYGPELARRIRMVAELRQAGKTVVHRPTFTPRPVRTAVTPRWAVAVAAGLAVVAVGAVAFVAASSGQAPKQALTAGPPPQTVPQNPVIPPDRSSPMPRDPVVVAPPKDDPKPETTPEYLKPHDVRIADTVLTAAISLVAAQSGLQVTIAPGFKDQRVTLDYRGLNTMDTLKAMGDEYGFSVLQQEEGHVLVLPVRPKDEDQRRAGP